MEVSNQNPVDSTGAASSSSEKDDLVAYESYKKSVAAEKSAKERARELQAELDIYKTKELEAKGEYEQITQNLKQQLLETQNLFREERERNAWSTVTGAIKAKAVERGFKNPDRLIRLFDKEDLSSLRAENGEIDGKSLDSLIERASRPDFLPTIQKPEMKFNDVTPSGNFGKPMKKSPSEMTKEELEAAIMALNKK